MKTDQIKNEFSPVEAARDRRGFLKGGIAALAGLWLLGEPGLGSLLEIDWRDARAEETATVPNAAEPAGLSKAVRFSTSIQKPFLNEKLAFDITFAGAKTASGLITFKQTDTNEYTASVEGTITGLVGAMTPFQKVVMTSVMHPIKTKIGERFVTKTFYRKTIRTSGTTESRHEFDYLRRKWTYTRVKDGTRDKGPVNRIIKEGVYYDDFVNILYNFRAQAYGAVKPGMKLTLPTMPWERSLKINGKNVKKTATTVEVFVPADGQLSDKDRAWLKDVGGDVLVIVTLDPDVYEIKSGQAKLAGTRTGLVPRGAWIEDALLFGDVKAKYKG